MTDAIYFKFTLPQPVHVFQFYHIDQLFQSSVVQEYKNTEDTPMLDLLLSLGYESNMGFWVIFETVRGKKAIIECFLKGGQKYLETKAVPSIAIQNFRCTSTFSEIESFPRTM